MHLNIYLYVCVCVFPNIYSYFQNINWKNSKWDLGCCTGVVNIMTLQQLNILELIIKQQKLGSKCFVKKYLGIMQQNAKQQNLFK